MGLIFTGEEVRTLSHVSLRAEDAKSGKVVPVKVSFEAEADHGLERAKGMAEQKYDKGVLEADGSVLVRTTDFYA